jgi:hypothetical protein
MLSLNSKHVQHVKVYLACNFKVNLITHLEDIALFSSNLKNANTFHPLFQTKLGTQINFKIAGHVDLHKLNIFSVYT